MDLKEKIEKIEAELETLKAELEKRERNDYPKHNEVYWYLAEDGDFYDKKWSASEFDKGAFSIGNVFHTSEEVKFAYEKLKVEAELRKFSRPFELMKDNHFITFNMQGGCLATRSRVHITAQGAIYFGSKEKAEEAVKSVGEERIKKYIFGVEG